MTPTLSSPKSGELRTLQIKAPFPGVYRRSARHMPEGMLWEANQTMMEETVIKSLPAFNATTASTTRMGWLAADEQIQGFIPGLDIEYYMLMTNERIHEHNFGNRPESGQVIAGTWTKVAGNAFIDDLAGVYDYTQGSYDAKVTPDSGTTWYTVVDIVPGGGNARINVLEAAGGFAGQSLEMYHRHFSDQTKTWSGPRYCYFGTDLIYCSKYATWYREPGAQGQLLTGIYRGRDVINFAGRPVLIGAVEAAAQYDTTPTPGLESNLLRWPTRGDFKDWASYGSGFLYTHDDQGSHRSACVWGEDAFLFTSTSIYRLIETGQSAANPIAFEKYPVKNYDPPLSNVVQGRKGLYYWSLRGPVLFDGRDLIPLYDVLEKDANLYGADLNLEGVFVWIDQYSQSVRFYNKRQHSNLLRYIYWEKTGSFTTLNSSSMYLAGLATTERIYYWGIDAQDIQSFSTPVSRQLDEFAGTLGEGGSAWHSGKIVIRGITFEEGAFINKVVRSVRVVGLFPTSTSGNNIFAVGAQPDNASPGLDWEVAITGSQNLQQFSFEITGDEVEAPVWCLRLDLPLRGEIHEIYIDYVLGSDLQHDSDVP